MVFLKLAWRNLFRNRGRTLVSTAAISIGFAAMIFYHGIFYGMKNNMYRTATESFLGDAQIHGIGYRSSRKVEDLITDLPALTDSLEAEEIVRAYSPRVYSYAMISSPANVSSVQLIGVDPEKEKKLSNMDENIAGGKYISGPDDNGLVIGIKLAEILRLEIGDAAVVTVSEAASGDLSQALFRVSGIFDTGDRNMNRSVALAGIETARGMLALEESAHEVAVDFTSLEYGLSDSLFFWDKYSRDGNKALSWRELAPQLVSAFQMSENIISFVGLIMFVLVAFVILNTIFMSLYERTFEFGVLLAQGTRPLQMGRIIVLESLSLAVVGLIAGSLLGLLVTLLFQNIGLGMSGEGVEFMNVTVTTDIYPVLEPEPFVKYSIGFMVCTFLISLYPAFHAARLKPARALSREL
ncbi:MAG: FtsX-like permease family protein [Candidatus Latescibacteria bacterium]|nr:FtsX-like permease family protein [bacterium]MBD3423169.1 FtsX-like permease family protein [Candidatus Latescibacterota bacterium]